MHPCVSVLPFKFRKTWVVLFLMTVATYIVLSTDSDACAYAYVFIHIQHTNSCSLTSQSCYHPTALYLQLYMST